MLLAGKAALVTGGGAGIGRGVRGFEDVGALAGFLASEQAGFITEAHYVPDGGMTRTMVCV